MMLFMFLPGVASVLLIVFLLTRKMMSPPPTPQSLHVQNLPETSLPKPYVKKEKKRGFMCKSSRRGITFKPEYKNKESAPKIVYMAHIQDSMTVVFFNDLYNTFDGKSNHVASRLFEMPVRDVERKYAINEIYNLNPPLHCKGLFVLPTRINTILVCNPATKEVRTLPQSSNTHAPRAGMKESLGANMRVGFGFVQSTQAYKVTQFFYRSFNIREKSYSMGFEVFTIGVSTCWRVLAQDPPYPIKLSCTMFTGKCIYFHIWHAITRNAPKAFLCFNVKNERFSILYPPFSVNHIDTATMTLSNLQSHLCLCLLNNSKICVFTTKGGMNYEWKPRFCFSIEPLYGRIEPIAEYQGNLLTRVIGYNSQRMVYYDSKDGSFEEVNGTLVDEKMEEEGCRIFGDKPWFSVSSYEESLFHLLPLV